ncbi:MAG: acetylserotonin O-methyltransferase [Candidatus Aminicenantes bacterium]|nr:acetylserotonin O-methyltransferase [Candidatus Aminicenantes bacterium]
MDPNRIVDMASAFYESCVLFAASDLGIFGKLAELGEADLETVIAACGLDRRSGRILLDACVALELLEKKAGHYRNSPEAALFLVPGSPADLSGAIRYNRDIYGAWGRLKEMAITGKPVERPETHLGEDEERTRTFVLAMHGRALGIGRAVVPLLDLAGRRKVLDVGGGPGTYSVLIAQAHPDVECTVIDLPEVVKTGALLIAQAGMSGRVMTLAGDYHTASFPAANDAVLFFGVLHQESEAAILDLLRRAYAALAPGGLVCVLDMMTDASRARPKFSALFSVNMALTTDHGWVFSEDDLEGWLSKAGFREYSSRPLPPPMPHRLAWASK